MAREMSVASEMSVARSTGLTHCVASLPPLPLHYPYARLWRWQLWSPVEAAEESAQHNVDSQLAWPPPVRYVRYVVN